MDTVEFKTFEAKIMPDDTAPDHYVFEGYVGAFGNQDSHDDILVKGAAAAQVGQTIHFFKDHYREFGAMDIVGEDEYGIKFVARAPKSDDNVVQVANRAKLGAPYQFSIGYVATKYRIEGNIRYLEQVQLMEGSIVTFGSNDKAVLTGIKSRYGDDYVIAGAAHKAVETNENAALVKLAQAMGVI